MSTWITATPPTPNGHLHVGHISGPYLAGDVMARALAADGQETWYSTGLDDNQTYVPRRSWGEGGTPEETAERYTRSIVDTWAAAGVRFDAIVRPHGVEYESRVRNLFSLLIESGHVVAEERPLPFCEPCDLWLYEAYLGGKCPHCGAGTNGNACEDCCRPNVCADVVDPFCIRCGATPEVRQTKLHVLPLEPLRDRLVEFWASCDMPERLRAVCRAMAAERLPDILVSHPSDWGIPTEADPALRTYVWLEMAEGYAAEAPPAGHDRLVQFFGIDNGYFHAVLFPAVNLALGREELLPEKFVVNEFFQLNGSKFSTSRRHAIWASELLPVVGADLLRLHCLLRRPATSRTDFTLDDLSRTEKVLDVWDATFRGVFALDGTATTVDEAALPADLRRSGRAVRAQLDLARRFCRPDDFDPPAAVEQLMSAARVIGSALDEVRAMGPEGTAAAAALRAWTAEFAEAAAPVVPDGSAYLRQACSGTERPARYFGLGVG
ncbi:class I tRNA ligase family protein [Actinoplanes hulinensis]|uniref:Class I tRNA ligase family protein n=1 Tax=Actinoplanes hulinensis TaxID=1144547 RepID=A0ABS7AUP2_9ACTN|nr:class I tRNA ligase family protein [Actinoplanes hulinensis]MBW6432470.1 class I tRNA ligase family protein [Actinoplanes hulinensis]